MTRPSELWISAVLGATSLLPGWLDPTLQDPAASDFARQILIGTTVVWLGLIALVILGAAWPRVVLAVLTVLGLGAMFLITGSPVGIGVQSLIVVVLQVAAVALLFSPRVTAWIQAERESYSVE